MVAIAVVDDRTEMRNTIAGIVRLQLRRLGVDWDVVAVAPLANLDEYPGFIKEQEIAVLLLDERLNEQRPEDGEPVDYDGHSVAVRVRSAYPDLPQFIITSVNDYDGLDGEAADLEDIVQRRDFRERKEIYVARMVRAGQRYSTRNREELARLDEIAKAVVEGVETEQDKVDLAAIRMKVQNQVSFETERELSAWIDEAEMLCAKLEESLDALGEDQGRSA